MNMFDEAAAIKTMLEIRGMTRAELSRSLGISESCIANKLRLLKLSDEVKSAIIKHGLTERHARLLLRLTDAEARLSLVKEISDRHLTVAEAEACLELRYLSNINSQDIASPMRNKKIPRPTEARDAFISGITKACASLTALGVSAGVTVSHYEKKSYITIVIEN